MISRTSFSVTAFFIFWFLDLTFSMLPAFFHAFGVDFLSYVFNSFRYFAFLCIFFYIVQKGKLSLGWPLYVLIPFLIIFCTGLVRWEFSVYSLRHIYAAILPIIGFSFGYSLRYTYPKIFDTFLQYLLTFSPFIILITIVYYIFYQSGIITYLGVSNPFAILLIVALYAGRFGSISIFQQAY